MKYYRWPASISDIAGTVCIPIISPSISVTKEASPSTIHSDETVTYWVNVTNTGDVNLSNIVIIDNQSLSFSYVSGDDDGIFEPGETWVYENITKIAEDTANKVNVSAQDGLGKTVYAEDTV